MENSMNDLYKKVTGKENNFNTRLNKLNDNKNIDDTSKKSYDSHGFNKDGLYKDTDRRYDPNGFDINGKHKDTNRRYDFNGFNIYRLHEDNK